MSHRGLRGYLFLPAPAFKGVNFWGPTRPNSEGRPAAAWQSASIVAPVQAHHLDAARRRRMNDGGLGRHLSRQVRSVRTSSRTRLPRPRGPGSTNALKTGRYNETLADIITNPGAMTKLKELRKLSPRSEKAINIVGSVLSGMGLELGQDELDPPTRGTSATDSTPRGSR
jgi:hypothetical protein